MKVSKTTEQYFQINSNVRQGLELKEKKHLAVMDFEPAMNMSKLVPLWSNGLASLHSYFSFKEKKYNRLLFKQGMFKIPTDQLLDTKKSETSEAPLTIFQYTC